MNNHTFYQQTDYHFHMHFDYIIIQAQNYNRLNDLITEVGSRATNVGKNPNEDWGQNLGNVEGIVQPKIFSSSRLHFLLENH